jgi:hypothetical protein
MFRLWPKLGKSLRCCHLRRLAHICQLPCCFGRHCLSRHCPTLSLSLPLRAGVLTLVALASPLAMHWSLCPPRAGIIAPVTLAFAPLVIVAELASLPALRWRFCQHCAGTFAGVALALFPQVSPPASCWRLCPPRAGAIAFVALASLP